MLFHITHISVNETEYVILHSAINVIARNDDKITEQSAIMVFRY